MGLDVETYDFTNNRPKTKFYSDIQEQNIPLIATFLNEKYLLPNEAKLKIKKELKIEIKANEFFEEFNNYLIDGNYKFESNSTSFGRQLKAYPSIVKFKKSSYYYSLNIKDLDTQLKEKYSSFNDIKNEDEFIDDDEDDGKIKATSIKFKDEPKIYQEVPNDWETDSDDENCDPEKKTIRTWHKTDKIQNIEGKYISPVAP